MTTTPPTGLQAIKALMDEFETIDAYLKAVHEIIDEGHMPDISGLDDRIAHLCATVESVSPDIQERCLAKLDDLLKKLDACEEEMKVFHAQRLQSGQQ